MKQQFSQVQPVNVSTILDELPDATGKIKAVLNYLVYTEDKINPFYFWGRVVAFIGILIWGWKFIMLDFSTSPFAINNSFMHLINLTFHEAGHVVFRPFGWFITILGGTLGQLLMPAVVMIVFLWKQRNTFGSSIGLWWLGQSFIDCSPYIDDAMDQQLVLITGKTGSDAPGTHDWNNILNEFNILEKHHAIASLADNIGSLLIILALVWGGTVLYRQYQRLESF